MARTKADAGKKAGGKAPRKAPTLRTTPAPKAAGVSKRKSSGGSRNAYCKRATPKWQKPIEEFLSKAGSSKEAAAGAPTETDALIENEELAGSFEESESGVLTEVATLNGKSAPKNNDVKVEGKEQTEEMEAKDQTEEMEAKDQTEEMEAKDQTEEMEAKDQTEEMVAKDQTEGMEAKDQIEGMEEKDQAENSDDKNKERGNEIEDLEEVNNKEVENENKKNIKNVSVNIKEDGQVSDDISEIPETIPEEMDG